MCRSLWIPSLDMIEKDFYVTTICPVVGLPGAIIRDMPMKVGILEMVS